MFGVFGGRPRDSIPMADDDNPPTPIARQILAASAADPPRLASALNAFGPYVKPLRSILGLAIDYTRNHWSKLLPDRLRADYEPSPRRTPWGTGGFA